MIEGGAHHLDLRYSNQGFIQDFLLGGEGVAYNVYVLYVCVTL